MSADNELATAVALLSQNLFGWGSREPGMRGLPREMAILALLLNRQSPGGLEHQLSRIVEHQEALGERTFTAIRKCASEARGLLHYGTVGGVPLTAAADTISATGPALALQLEDLVMAVNKDQALEDRMQNLGGVRGGRPPRVKRLQVLSALIELGDLAQSGDTGADTELRLIEDYLRRRTA